MTYRKVPLQKLKAWDSVGCHHVGPFGTPLGTAHEPGIGYFVVTWALDGSVLSSTGPFDVVLTTGAMNAAGEVMAAVRPLGASRIRPVLIHRGEVRDFGDSFADTAVVLAVNSAGTAVGAEVIAGTTNYRPFALDVRTGVVRHLEPPAGAVSAMATGVNQAGDIVVTGYKTFGDHQSLLYAGGSVRQELGALYVSDINEHRVCSAFRGEVAARAGLLDASGVTPVWTEFPLPPDAVLTRGRAINDKGQSIVMAEYGVSAKSHYRPFLWSDGALRSFGDLVLGDYLVPLGLSEAGDVATTEAGSPVLLTTSRPVRVTIDLGRPLWEIVLAGSTQSGGPSFGIGGVSVRLPNGQVLELPTIPIPNEPAPAPEWAGLNEAQRVALLSATLASLAQQVHDPHGRDVLTHAAHELLKRRGN